MVAREAQDIGGGFESGKEVGFGQPEEGGERFGAGGELFVEAEEEGDGIRFRARDVFQGDQAGFGRESINQFIAGEGLHDGRKHRRCAGVREVLSAGRMG